MSAWPLVASAAELADFVEPVASELSQADMIDIAELSVGQSVFIPNCPPIPFRWTALDLFELAREVRGGVGGLVVSRVAA